MYSAAKRAPCLSSMFVTPFSAPSRPRGTTEGMYEFKVDLNDDAVEDLAYRFTFNERDKDGNRT